MKGERLVAVVVLGLLILAMGLIEQQRAAVQPGRSDTYPSTFYSDSAGARALYLVLERLFPRVEQWRRPLGQLPNPAGGRSAEPLAGDSDADASGSAAGRGIGTLIVAGPRLPIRPSDALALDQWVATGGQLVLALDADWPIAAPTRSQAFWEDEETRKDGAGYLARHGISLRQGGGTAAVWPASIDGLPGGVRGLFLERDITWGGPGRPIASSDGRPIAVALTHGSGRIVVIGSAAAVSNRGLRQGDNALWLTTLCAMYPGTVRFDEYHHGFGEPRALPALVMEFLFGTVWGWAILQAGLVGLLYLFGSGRRLGRPVMAGSGRGPRLTDLVDARAWLFRTAQSHALGVELLVSRMLQNLGGPTGREWTVDELRQRVARAPRSERLSAEVEAVTAAFEAARAGKSITDKTFRRVAHATAIIQRELNREQ